jgi:5-methyltetrahydropteroyltriglutamate--homocysteine methyltransferase
MSAFELICDGSDRVWRDRQIRRYGGVSMVRTTVVGSWPIPPSLKPQLTAYYRGHSSDDEAAEILQTAAAVAMQEQKDCGLDQIMGGETFAPDFVHHVPPRLAGLRCVKRRDHRAGYEGIAVYAIEGDISAPRGTGHALAYRREKEMEPALDKAAVPSALTMTIPFLADPRVEEQMPNIATVVEAEVLDMVAAGAGEVQLDAPAEAVQLILGVRPAEQILEWLLFPFRNVTGVRRTIHLCLGDMGRRPFTQEQNLHAMMPLLEQLNRRVDRVHVECSYAGQWKEHALLARVPSSIEIIAGIADVKGDVPSVRELRTKIEALLQVAPEDRLLLSSSCGCGRCTPEQAKALMRNLVAAASDVP